MASRSLPYHTQDVHYDNAKFRHRSPFKVITQALATSRIRYNCGGCSTGKFLMLLMIVGLTFLIVHKSSNQSTSSVLLNGAASEEPKHVNKGISRIRRIWRKPPRLPPRLPPNEVQNVNSSLEQERFVWVSRQQKVKEAFLHAWSGYRNYAMGYDELKPLSKRGTDGLGGLGATIIDSLDTSIIMGADEIVSEAVTWIENQLKERIEKKGQVNLFETTIRVLGGLLSAYHLSEGDKGNISDSGIPMTLKGVKPELFVEIAKDLADRLLSAFTSSPTPIPFSDVILHDRSAHPAPDGFSSTSEVSTLQLEFNYLSKISGDPKYGSEAMKVLEHFRTLPKVEGLVPIYISPHSGQFSGENIRLGSRGDSYYEYLIKVWIQQRNSGNQINYLYEMYEQAMRGVKNLLVRKSVPKGLVFVGELPYGPKGSFSPKMDHLVCFLPGTLALGATKGMTKKKAMELSMLKTEDLENLKLAEDLAKTCFQMYAVTSTGLAPEIAYFNIEGDSEGGGLDGGNKSSEYINDIIIKHNDRHNLLRPETVESLFVLHRITEDPKYREWGWQIFEAFEKYTKVESGGYTSLDDVTVIPPHTRDKMETFFLGETLKYLYLLFGDDNVLPLDKFVFNTEAHPLPIISSEDSA
ncbi:mannosyl-oligosaccharide 1,2-alpha-mannosidase MNS3 [Canna indica]|uniref:alpha-1,2-Mannosidase n=1 Tax=Canna indica TaxID=4628 RepID=A0AAQ3QB16_9LILI|nr:mannosyl-oligosaccharide 1,2-alpha-mannosidase MNS3 [Canna indica]